MSIKFSSRSLAQSISSVIVSQEHELRLSLTYYASHETVVFKHFLIETHIDFPRTEISETGSLNHDGQSESFQQQDTSLDPSTAEPHHFHPR
ncbi:MAG: hypothetical protein ABL965_02570, partial [Nitrospira sp.]